MRMGGGTRLDRARERLAQRLRLRRAEIEQAILTRAYGVSDTSGIADPQYVEGLRVAVTTAVEYGLTVIEHGDNRQLSIPPALLVQARTAARFGIGLDTVMRRYCAGSALFGDFLIEEATKDELVSEDLLKQALRTQAVLLDRLLATVGEEHARESDVSPANAEARRAERVQRLLDGEPLDPSDLDYGLEGHHLGLVAVGPDALEVVRFLGDATDCRSLVVPRGETMVWAWFGGRRSLDPTELKKVVGGVPVRGSIAFGEPGKGLRGWRLTHEQARAALSVAMRTPGSLVRYVEVALVASVLRDSLLCTSLRQLYLAPLEQERDGGAALRETLRAYISAERNVSSAASALGVSRRTVANRLRIVEKRIGQPLRLVLPEIEAALRLDELERRRPDRSRLDHGS